MSSTPPPYPWPNHAATLALRRSIEGKTVDLRLENANAAACVDELSRLGGVPVVLRAPLDPGKALSLWLNEVEFELLLDLVADHLELEVAYTTDGVVFRPRGSPLPDEEAEWALLPLPDLPPEELLPPAPGESGGSADDRPLYPRVSVRLEKVGLREIVFFLDDLSGINIVLGPEVSPELGDQPMSIDAMNVPVDAALERAIRPYGLTVETRDDLLFVTRLDPATEEFDLATAERLRDVARLRAILLSPARLGLSGAAPARALQALEDRIGIRVLVEPAVWGLADPITIPEDPSLRVQDVRELIELQAGLVLEPATNAAGELVFRAVTGETGGFGKRILVVAPRQGMGADALRIRSPLEAEARAAWEACRRLADLGAAAPGHDFLEAARRAARSLDAIEGFDASIDRVLGAPAYLARFEEAERSLPAQLERDRAALQSLREELKLLPPEPPGEAGRAGTTRRELQLKISAAELNLSRLEAHLMEGTPPKLLQARALAEASVRVRSGEPWARVFPAGVEAFERAVLVRSSRDRLLEELAQPDTDADHRAWIVTRLAEVNAELAQLEGGPR